MYNNLYMTHSIKAGRHPMELSTMWAMREVKKGTWKYGKDGEGKCLYRKVRLIESSELEVRKR